jgi:hypothetical protein
MKRLLALVALVVAGSIGKAEATTITFDDLLFLDPAGIGGDRTSGGFLFDTANNHSHLVTVGFGSANGTQFMIIDDQGGVHPPGSANATTISQGGALFGLASIDISEVDRFETFARQVQVTGNLFGGGTVSTVLTLDAVFFEAIPANYFQTFTFDATWNNLTSVVLTGTGAPTPDRNYYGIDNVVVTSAVPEPGTLLLLASGLIAGVRARMRSFPQSV